MNSIDLVFPYVDCNEPVWQKSYKELRRALDLPSTINNVRFRQWDNLRYLFRGIENCLPFIRKVHMIVSNLEQVPDWLNTENVNIVLHKDIIPPKFLPTFNSTTIEMFLGNIPDLADGFIYANDDTFFLKERIDEDFFDGDKVKLILKTDSGSSTMFKKVERNCIKAIKEYLGIVGGLVRTDYLDFIGDSSTDSSGESGGEDEEGTFLKFGHTVIPKRKETFLLLSHDLEDKIKNSITPFRKEKNFNQYLFSYYDYYSGNSLDSSLNYKYFTFKDGEYAIDKALIVADTIRERKYDTICINDSKDFRSEAEFLAVKKIINNAFEHIFPIPSKYELDTINIIEKEFRITQIIDSLVIRVDYSSIEEKRKLAKEIVKAIKSVKGIDDSDDSGDNS